MNNIFIQIVALGCCIFTVYTVLKYAYQVFRRMKYVRLSKDSVQEIEKDCTLQEQDVKPLSEMKREMFSKEIYKKRFFTKLTLKYRSQTYIEKEYHDCLKRLIALVAPGTSTSSYINIIVEDHLWRNSDVIKELLNDVKDKPL